VIRTGPRVTRASFDDAAGALDALEAHCREVVQFGERGTVKAGPREYAPHQQVASRAELRGPGRLRAGADVRGDGTVEPYLGRVVRRPVEVRDDETPYAALRRAVSSGSTSVDP
jgi:hypothetical protein